MYLSRIALNTRGKETMRALVSPQLLHSLVEQSFEGERQRNLWRIDWLGDNCYLLVLSKVQPNFLRLSERIGHHSSEQCWETKEYIKLLERMREGQAWKFRLRANPVRSSHREKDSASGRGRVFAHVTPAQQCQWLLEKSQSCGFELEENRFQVVDTQWEKFYKKQGADQKVMIRTATFEGLLTIKDIDLFKHSLTSGIGRAKAYGCGLLTIAGIRENNNE